MLSVAGAEINQRTAQIVRHLVCVTKTIPEGDCRSIQVLRVDTVRWVLFNDVKDVTIGAYALWAPTESLLPVVHHVSVVCVAELWTT